jgi:hypothetical protein
MLLNEKELDIALQRDINTYLYHAYPLCIILSEKKFIPWYYEHFIQIYSANIVRKSYSGWSISPAISKKVVDAHQSPTSFEEGMRMKEETFFDFLELGSYRMLLDVNSINNIHAKDFIDFAIKEIESGCYIYVFFDEYYLKGKYSYRKSHFFHESLLFGYNNKSKLFKSVGFDSNRIFTVLDIYYDDAFLSYSSSVDTVANIPSKFSLVQSVKKRNSFLEYPFNVRKFLLEMHDYIYSKADASKFFYAKCDDFLMIDPSFEIDDNLIKFGLDIYEDVISGLINLTKGGSIFDYRYIHLIYEHKIGLLKRFYYIERLLDMKDDYKTLLEEYKIMADSFNVARIKFLKFRVSNDLKIVWDLIDFINKIRITERELMENIFEVMCKYLNISLLI